MRLATSLSLLISLFLSSLSTLASDYGFEVRRAALEHGESGYLLNADIDFRFSPTAVEALQHGVPISVVLHFQLRRQRDHWPDQLLTSKLRRLEIRYHPLARTYRIHSGAPAKNSSQSFAGLPALLETLGAQRNWRVMEAGQLRADERYEAVLWATLDIEALPLPLRPVAYFSPEWYLGSPRFPWRPAD